MAPNFEIRDDLARDRTRAHIATRQTDARAQRAERIDVVGVAMIDATAGAAVGRQVRGARPKYRTELKSLERAFQELDSNVIASVLERRQGNVDLAAADLLDLKPSSGAIGAKRAKDERGEREFWTEVLDDASASASAEDGSMDSSREFVRSRKGAKSYGWGSEQWALEPSESVRLGDVEMIVGWRTVERAGESDVADAEVLIKWRGVSYAHCTWVRTSAIENDVATGMHGKMRVGRYFEKFPKADGPRVDVKPDYLVVSRVFAKFEELEQTLVCVKWMNMSYDETTWENAEYVRNVAKGGAAAMDEFERVHSKASSAAERQAEIDGESEEDIVKAWSTYAEEPTLDKYGSSDALRSYQVEGVKWMAFNFKAGRGCILGDEMGLGKTAQALALINHCLRVRSGLPVLIVVPLSTIVNWEREAKRWIPEAYLVPHVGKQAGRDFAREHDWYFPPSEDPSAPRGMKADVVLTTYETITADRSSFSKVKWSTIVVDEAHRLKRVGGKLGNDLGSLSVERVCLLTGTPLQNNTTELWSLLNFVDAKHFSNSEDFEAAFGGMAKAAQVERLQKVLGPYILRRLKQDVEQKLPPRSETLVECELAPLQKKCYRALFERNFSFLRQGCDSKENFGNFANVMMEVRKCCQHPFLLDGVEAAIAPEGANVATLVSSAGKLQLLDKLLPHLKEGGHRGLIFSQMTRVLDVLEDYCRARGHTYVRLDGSITGKARQEAIDQYCKKDSEIFLFLLSTRAGGQGINLVEADTVIMFDSDWNPQNDAQALARAHRIGQTRTVQVYRLVMRATYEKEMFTRASMKLGLEQAIFGNAAEKEEKSSAASRKEIEDLLKHGAYGLFTDDDGRSKQWNADSITDILARSEQKLIESAERNSESAASGPSTFATATFVEEGGSADGVALDDPEFWQKLMPEVAAAEEERRVEAVELMAKMQAAERLALEKQNSKTTFDWSWGERKRIVAALILFGWGNWECIMERSQVKDNKTIAHIKLFCRMYVEEALKSAHTELFPNFIAALTVPADEDETSLPEDQGRDLLAFIMAEQGFENFVRGRANDDLARLELLQGGIDAVARAGGAANALTSMPIPELHADPLSDWWTEEHDRALVVGTLKHGYGKYAEIRDDIELPFAATFAGLAAPEPSKKDAKRPDSPLSKAQDELQHKIVAEEAPVEWIHGRHLSNRVKRVFSVLGGKSYEPPPKIERPPREKKVKVKVPKAPKVKGAPRTGGGTTLEKFHKAQEFIKELKRDANGAFVTPIGPMGGVTIESLGEVRLNKHFVSENYILPVGFKTTRMYPRLDNLNDRIKWEQEISVSSSGEPQFTLTAEEGCEPIVAKSATAAWAEVLKRVKSVREANGEVAKKTAISGPEFFGYSLPNIRLLIESLPGADACSTKFSYISLAKACEKTEQIRKERGESSKSPLDVKRPAKAMKVDAFASELMEIDLSQGYEDLTVFEDDLLV